MADAIAQGIHEVDPGVAVKIFNVARHDKNEILTQVFRSKGVLVGSSTMNNVMMPKVAGMLEEITGLPLQKQARLGLRQLRLDRRCGGSSFHAPAGCGFRNVA
ncbi:hypothetical protein ACLK16_14310 [Escherichia coli]